MHLNIVAPQSVQQILQQGAPEQLLHVYGSTESTTFSTAYRVENVPQGATTLPIGRAIANTQIYILDHHLQPVPIGVAGELYIGGDGLARGYLNRPELTADKFISNPFCAGRLYKTGDLVRYLPDGNIEFIGRIDNQVKIRGFRIELGEIETVLSQHPDLEETVVIARENQPGDKYIAAYIVAKANKVLTPKQLRHFLKQQLPEYMIPAAFVPLEALPMTPNGKIDRRQLSAPESLTTPLEDTFVAPTDELELQLVQIWEQVLGKKPIGIADNFFDLGGHSLLAVTLFSQIEKHLGHKLPLSQLFQCPTIQELATLLRDSRWQPSWSSLVAIKPGGTYPPLFCAHPMGGEVFCYQPLSHYLDAEQPLYALRAQGLDGQHPPHTCIEEMAADYLQEIIQVQPIGPYFLGGASSGGRVAFEMARQLSEQGQSVAFLALFDCGLPDNWILKPTKFQPHGQSSEEIKKVVEANRLALNHYYPKADRGRAILFICDWKVWENESSLQIVEQGSKQHLLSEFIIGGCELQEVPGDHMNIFDEPNVQILSEKLAICLEQARLQSP